MNKRVIAIHLPQFHPFLENDEWWGKGFTEWTNVTKAKPRFLGHYQPHLPSDTGFYDLRLPEAREMQANMAREYGIYGFCYYHYWFNGKRLMDRPVKEILASGQPDFPFMLCWANENWSRNWDGLTHFKILHRGSLPYPFFADFWNLFGSMAVLSHSSGTINRIFKVFQNKDRPVPSAEQGGLLHIII